MKNIILITGTIGVGKSRISHMLTHLVEPSAYLDGEWCWCVHPDHQNQTALLDNLANLLRTYLHADTVDNIILDWAVYDEAVIDSLLSRLEQENFKLYKYTLISTEDVLRSRLVYDITAGYRDASVVAESVAKMPLFEQMNTTKIEVTIKNDIDIARQIASEIKPA